MLIEEIKEAKLCSTDEIIYAHQVPAGDSKKDLLDHLDKVPTYVQTLQFTVKEPTVGKAATFLKVDHVIKETKNLMNVINKVVTTCFDCANKVSEFFFLLLSNFQFVSLFWIKSCQTFRIYSVETNSACFIEVLV